MAHGHKTIAKRLTRGHDSTAAFVAHEGQKRLSKAQLIRMQRIREGRCPSCGGEVSDDVRAGRVVIRGHVVNKCDKCRKERRESRSDRGPREETAVGTLIGERLSQLSEIDHAADRFKASKTSTILIVGVMPNNIQREARDHPRIITWESGSSRNSSALPVIPSSVSIIMCTRFCAHPMSQYLQRSAKERKIFMFQGLLATGEMRRHLAELLDLDRNKAHDGADDLGAPAPPPVTLVAPKKVETLMTTPPPAASAQQKPATGDSAANEKIDNAIHFIKESMAAMALVVEQLETVKQVIAENAEAGETLATLKKLLNR